MKNIAAILLMAGNGMRFGSALPKQFHRISGKKIYVHTLEKFLHSQLFDEIILACPKEWLEEVKKEVSIYSQTPIRVIAGGETRQQSSFLSLLACHKETKYVVIHDAVRPFIDVEILKKNVDNAILYKAVDTCIPSADTLVHSECGQMISSIPKRSQYLRGQTPQSFSYPLILEAHQHAQKCSIQNASDDCSLVLAMGEKVHIVKGNEHNLKITSELDLFLAEQLFRRASFLEISQEDSCLQLRGKQFAITGGTGDIGKALCHLLESQGARVFILSRTSQNYPLDITCFEQVQEKFKEIFKTYGPLDGLINCVGLLKVKELEDLSSSDIEELIDVNLKGVIFSCKCAQIKAGGHLINVASSAYSRGRRSLSIYACAKAAVVNFTQGLAEERPDLKINVLVPQRTLSRMRQEHFPEETPESLLTPQDIAQEILAILKHSTVTGAIIDVRHKSPCKRDEYIHLLQE